MRDDEFYYNTYITLLLRTEVKDYDSQNPVAFKEDLGLRLLLWTACCGQLRVVELLIEIGVNLDGRDKDGYTALHKAVQHSRLLVVRALLNAGASADCKYNDESTPLFFAAANGDEKMIRCLLKAGAGINERYYWNPTPLHLAVGSDRYPAIELLLAAGSDPNASDNYGDTPIFSARSEAAVKMLITWGGRVDVRNKRNQTPLHDAIRFLNLALSSAMLDAGADPNASDIDGKTPLHFAAKRGDAEKVKLLLQNKSNPYILDNKGNTPLHVAASRGHVSVFKRLMDSGEDLSLNLHLFYNYYHQASLPILAAFASPSNNERTKREMFKVWWSRRPLANDMGAPGFLISDIDQLCFDELRNLLWNWRLYIQEHYLV